MKSNDMACILDGIGPYGGIYICSLQLALNQSLLKKYKIQAGIYIKDNQTNQSLSKFFKQFMILDKKDFSNQRKSICFDDTNKFIEDNKTKTNILIFCQTGDEMSPIIVLAYLMKKYNYNLGTVTSMVKRRRSSINTQQHLLILKEYQTSLGIKTPQSKFKSKIFQTYKSTTLQSLKSENKKLTLNLGSIENVQQIPQKSKQYSSFTQQIEKLQTTFCNSPKMKEFSTNDDLAMPKLRARSSILKKNGSVTQRKPRQKSVRFEKQ